VIIVAAIFCQAVEVSLKLLRTDDKVNKFEAMRELCERCGHSLVHTAMGWLASRPCVSGVIAGVTTTRQLEQNVEAEGWRPGE
jgi:aryl-alcohol dehydrogenase-like predicted oxidoreductase